MAKKNFIKKFQMENNENKRVELQFRNSAFDRRISTFAIVNKVQRVSIVEFLKDAFDIYESEMNRAVELNNMVKSISILTAEFEKDIPKTNLNENEDNMSDNSDQKIKETLYFPTPNVLIGINADMEKHYEMNIVNEILKSVENMTIRGSGFTLARIIELNVQISSYQPLDGSSYVATPKDLNAKKAIINVMNLRDEMCFKWAILSALHPAKTNPHRLQNYIKYKDELNFDGIEFPVNLKDIDKFTKQNEDISINVYYFDDSVVPVRLCPLRVSNEVKKHHIHLLMLIGKNRIDTDDAHTTVGKIKVMLESGQNRSHYCWIKNLSRLVSSQLSDHDHKKHICDRCLN